MTEPHHQHATRLKDEVTPADREAVLSGLKAFNTDKTGCPPPQPVAVLVEGNAGETRGGLIGRTGYGWLSIELFFLPENVRKGGLGSSILRQAEAEAIRRGCHSARVETASFQALEFYRKAGYRVFATLENYPEAHESYYLRKELRPDVEAR